MSTSSPTAAGPRSPWAATRVIPGVLAALGLVAVVYALADVRVGALHDVRVVVTAVSAILGPGWALAGFLRGRSLAERVVLAAGSGTAVCILAGQVMVVTGAWHPVGLFLVVTALTVPVLVRHAVAGS